MTRLTDGELAEIEARSNTKCICAGHEGHATCDDIEFLLRDLRAARAVVDAVRMLPQNHEGHPLYRAIAAYDGRRA